MLTIPAIRHLEGTFVKISNSAGNIVTCLNQLYFLSALPVEKISQLSRDMRLTTMWYVRPAKAQTSLRIRAV